MESFGVINYITYVLGTMMIILLPGPNSLYVLSLSAQHGARHGWSAACGVFVGDAILMLLTAFGAASVLSANPLLFNIIKYAGAIYLCYIGLKLVISAINNWKTHQNIDAMIEAAPTLKKTSAASAFNKALMVSLLNPKAILFFLSFFVQFVDPSYKNPFIPFAILAVTLQFFSFTYLAMLIYAGNKLSNAFKKHKKVSAVSSGSVGAGFILFALKLALASV